MVIKIDMVSDPLQLYLVGKTGIMLKQKVIIKFEIVLDLTKENIRCSERALQRLLVLTGTSWKKSVGNNI